MAVFFGKDEMIPAGGYLKDNPGTPPGLDAMARIQNTNTIPISPAPCASKNGHGPNGPMCSGRGVVVPPVPPGSLHVKLSEYTGSTQALWSGTSSSSEPEMLG